MNFKVVLKTLISRFHEAGVEFALSGGLALSTMGIFRLTRDIDFVAVEDSMTAIEGIMTDLGYEKQDFSTEDIVSYFSPLKVYGQVDFLVARRKYTRAMLKRAPEKPVFDGEFQVKTLLPEDLIGLKVQALVNDEKNRYPVDVPDIQQLLRLHKDHMNMELVREYFQIFEKEELLDAWLADLD